MPPTIQPNERSNREKRTKPGEKQRTLLCRVRYSNTLPDIPFDPKFISYPFEANRFVQYNPTSLERNFKYDLLTEHDLGVPIDLINPNAYAIDSSSYLAPEDERLLEEETQNSTDSKRSKRHNTAVSWLRKTEYIASENQRTQFKSDKVEAKVGFNIKKLFNPDDLYKDRDSQIQTIERTFESFKVLPKVHHTKSNVHAVSSMAVLPDFQMWKYPFAQVMFDSDPAPKPGSSAEEMSQAMIRGMKDESGEQFVAYFLPTEETINKRHDDKESGLYYKPEETYDFMLAREYTWNVKNKATKGYEEMYFFLERGGTFSYNELETRVRLTKRRKTGGGPVAKTRLIVRHRPMNAVEEGEMERRLALLDPTVEEEDEEGSPAKEAAGSGSDEAESDAEPSKTTPAAAKQSASSSDSSSSDSSSGSSSDSSSESEAEAGKEADGNKAEIFGSSDSD